MDDNKTPPPPPLSLNMSLTAGEMGESVQVLCSRFVRPATTDGIPPRYPLTAFDGAIRFVPYQKRILFFARHREDQDFAAVVAALEESLRRVLVKYHSLCGRMILGGGNDGDDDDDGAGMEIDLSGDLSVRFSEAETTARLEELGNFESSDFCDSLCEIGSSANYPWDPELPLLIVQVTRFTCGGLSLGVAFSHQVVDGVSLWKFMNSWAESTRSGGTSALPEVTRSGYKCPGFSLEEMEAQLRALGFEVDDGFASNEKTGTLAEGNSSKAHGEDEQTSKGSSNADSDLTFNQSQGKLAIKKYKVSGESIQSLKKAAPGFTSFELLCASHWRKMVAGAVAARFLAHNEDCYFLIPINCRGKIKSLPSSFSGNAVAVTRAQAKVAELLAEDGLKSIAGLLHDAIRKVDERNAEVSVAAVNGFMKRMVKGKPAGKLPAYKPGQFVGVVSSPRHPVYECDFGFGRPVGVTFGMNDLGDSKLYLFPAADGEGGVDVSFCMRTEALEKLATY